MVLDVGCQSLLDAYRFLGQPDCFLSWFREASHWGSEGCSPLPQGFMATKPCYIPMLTLLAWARLQFCYRSPIQGCNAVSLSVLSNVASEFCGSDNLCKQSSKLRQKEETQIQTRPTQFIAGTEHLVYLWIPKIESNHQIKN